MQHSEKYRKQNEKRTEAKDPCTVYEDEQHEFNIFCGFLWIDKKCRCGARLSDFSSGIGGF